MGDNKSFIFYVASLPWFYLFFLSCVGCGFNAPKSKCSGYYKLGYFSNSLTLLNDILFQVDFSNWHKINTKICLYVERCVHYDQYCTTFLQSDYRRKRKTDMRDLGQEQCLKAIQKVDTDAILF